MIAITTRSSIRVNASEECVCAWKPLSGFCRLIRMMTKHYALSLTSTQSSRNLTESWLDHLLETLAGRDFRLSPRLVARRAARRSGLSRTGITCHRVGTTRSLDNRRSLWPWRFPAASRSFFRSLAARIPPRKRPFPRRGSLPDTGEPRLTSAFDSIRSRRALLGSTGAHDGVASEVVEMRVSDVERPDPRFIFGYRDVRPAIGLMARELARMLRFASWRCDVQAAMRFPC